MDHLMIYRMIALGNRPVEEWVRAVGGHGPGVLGHRGGHGVGATAVLFHAGG